MLANPASDEDLLKIFKVYSEHSVGAAIRALYDKGVADAELAISHEIAGTSSLEPKPAEFILDEFGASQPFVPTSNPSKSW